MQNQLKNQEISKLSYLENQDIIHQFSFGYQSKIDLYGGEARDYLHKKIENDPDDADSLECLGISYISDAKRTGDFKTGINYLFAALQKDPTNPIYIYNLGRGAFIYKNFTTAEAMFQAALSLNPRHINTLSGLCELYLETNQLDKVYTYIQIMKNLYPENNLVTIYEIYYLIDRRDFKQAEQLCLSLLAKYPYFINGHLTLVSIYNKQGRIKRGTKTYIQALRVCPHDPHLEMNLALALLNQNKMKSGFRFYKSRHKILNESKAFERIKSVPNWTGQDLTHKKIFICLEQGIGDMINFIPLLQIALQKWNCTIYCFMYESLTPLFRQSISHPSLHWLDTLSEIENFSFDYKAPLMDLLSNLDFSLTKAQWPTQYLKPSPQLIDTWKKQLQAYPKPKIGINWQGNIMHKNDRNRSIPLETFMTIFKDHDKNGTQNFHLFNLHVPEADNRDAFNQLISGTGIIDTTSQFKNCHDSAAFIMNLDLIITVDTATAHLAGALGKKTLTLLALDNDWRWFQSGDQTIWYPSMTLLRQKIYKDWTSVLEDVKNNLLLCS